MKLAVCIPSRGLIHSRTIEGVMASLEFFSAVGLVTPRPPKVKERVETEFFFSHGLPIPVCFNHIVARAMDWGADYIWVVEEDIVPDTQTLTRMYDETLKGSDIACVDYILEDGKRVTVKHENGIQVTGTGCILVKREVFEKIGVPYFKTNIDLMIINGELEPKETKAAPKDRYGYHDAYFYWQCKQLGLKVKIIPEPMVGHLRVVEMGAKHRNDGFHIVKDLSHEPPVST